MREPNKLTKEDLDLVAEMVGEIDEWFADDRRHQYSVSRTVGPHRTTPERILREVARRVRAAGWHVALSGVQLVVTRP